MNDLLNPLNPALAVSNVSLDVRDSVADVALKHGFGVRVQVDVVNAVSHPDDCLLDRYLFLRCLFDAFEDRRVSSPEAPDTLTDGRLDHPLSSRVSFRRLRDLLDART